MQQTSVKAQSRPSRHWHCPVSVGRKRDLLPVGGKLKHAKAGLGLLTYRSNSTSRRHAVLRNLPSTIGTLSPEVSTLQSDRSATVLVCQVNSMFRDSGANRRNIRVQLRRTFDCSAPKFDQAQTNRTARFCCLALLRTRAWPRTNGLICNHCILSQTTHLASMLLLHCRYALHGNARCLHTPPNNSRLFQRRSHHNKRGHGLRVCAEALTKVL